MNNKSKKKYDLIEIFEKKVETYPNKIAIIFSNNQKITYSELNGKANQLANVLISNKLSHGDVLCISGEKNINTYATILACLKIGIIYSIYDPKSPVERLKKIFAKCRPKGVIINKNEIELKKIIKNNKEINLIINNSISDNELINYSKNFITNYSKFDSSSAAYIMFTSGSTGVPKGALISRNNLEVFISWCLKKYQINKDDVISGVNPLYFDNSVFDLYSSIFNGATLLSISENIVKKPHELIQILDKHKCTQLFSVPSLFIYMSTLRAFTKTNLIYMKRIIFGGEGYPKIKLKQIYDLYYKRISFINVYGPTECTCICSAYYIEKKDLEDEIGLPPIGNIGKHFDYVLLDEETNESRADYGELCLIGPCVGQGYYNDTERTNEVFVSCKHSNNYEKMYKTGDLLRYDEKLNKLYFVSRKDNQIKHMGYRIELDEIEAACNSIEYVNEAAAFHGQINNISNICLAISSDQSINEKDLKKKLKKIIPEYMIPSKIQFFQVLKKNANGKIDRVKIKKMFNFDQVI